MATIKITQVRSAIKRQANQRKTLEALGIKRMHQTVEHSDTPQILGMIDKVSHLVKVEQAG
ncbi:TPA: 50S ribosomal protein L30 [Candidatus Latescibacteria bacterium]|nr:50S ribosomal protein L30 [Gemmatimonadota bacterium]HAA78462.1 50S ribosomal protein L30 [Candidatus Latescibacterota bacterium]|tara:strand:- start:764 stop:946 length:183 start_codon:yes stop_codon:yes gene_type:complete